MAEQAEKYYYERFEWDEISLARKTKIPDWFVFLKKIQLVGQQGKDFGKENEHLLKDFATHILGNIHWYEKRIIKEKTLRLAYILVSLSLLLIVPILVALIEARTASVSAQVTAIFTGIFALYQGVSKWLEQRNLIGIYWQTKSNLKSRLYSLEDKWIYTRQRSGRNWEQADLMELREDLSKAVYYGMQCQKVEKQLFFESYNYPQFDLLGTMIGVRKQVRELFDGSGRSGQTAAVAQGKPAVTPKEKLARLTEQADEPTATRISKKTDGTTQPEIGPQPLPVGSGGVPQAPSLVTRAGWEAKPPRSNGKPSLGTIKAFVIHHAAGYWDQPGKGKHQMREIQKLHQSKRTLPNGRTIGPWMDIGYHFVIDPEGNIYQGREFRNNAKTLEDKPQFITGAHVGGKNSGRLGICLLGNFEKSEPPTAAARASLLALLRYLKHTYQPIGDELVNGQIIAGHKDYKSTSCPGSKLYALLDELRASVPQ